MRIDIKRMSETAVIPEYKTDGAAAFDLVATNNAYIMPTRTKAIHTGISMAIPFGFCGIIVPRSGLGSKGLVLANGSGVIDSDYRGEIICKMHNRADELNFRIVAGDRVAQLLIMPVVQAQFIEVDELPETVRGDGGFGHTGK